MSSLRDKVSLGGFDLTIPRRRTLAYAIDCVGAGLHSGVPVRLKLCPAPPEAGIVFRRTDTGRQVAARFDAVSDTVLCTILGEDKARIGTIEHLMAALYASQIDDALIEIDAPELPIFDGSAAAFMFLIASAGITEHGGERGCIEILRKVRVECGDAFAELRPHRAGVFSANGLDLSLAIDFPSAAIGRQAFSMSLSKESFSTDLAAARTFTQAAEIERLRQAGLAKGGSLKNAIVVDDARVLNPEGLRWRDEFVRHKLLDAVGDLALAGAPLIGRFLGHRSGHALNNKLLRALFADPANYRRISSVFAPSLEERQYAHS